MKGRNITIVGIVACSLAALLFIFIKVIDYRALTLAGGILFVLAGLLDIAFYNNKGREGLAPVMGAITDMGCIMLGMAMLVFSSEFVTMTTFMLGVAVAIMALWQFFILAIGARPYQLPSWLYIFPVALLGTSIYIFVCRQSGYNTALIVTTGVALAITGGGSLIEGSILGVARRNYIKAQNEAATQPETTNNTTASATVSHNQSDNTNDDGVIIDFSDIDGPTGNTTTVDNNITPSRATSRAIETTDDLDDEIIE